MYVWLKQSPQTSTWDRNWVEQSKCGVIPTTGEVLGNSLHSLDRRWSVIVFLQYGKYHISTEIPGMILSYCTSLVPHNVYSYCCGGVRQCVGHGWQESCCIAVVIYQHRLYVAGAVLLYYRYGWFCCFRKAHA